MQREVICEFSMFPIGKGVSLSTYVARIEKIIRSSGLPYSFGPMGTVVEGSYEEISRLIGECMEELKNDCERISTSIKMDYRKGREGAIQSKVESVEAKLK
ncbi:MAG: MTH1187 family thiamine-binding protein [Spirochaetia bacterium]